MTTPQDISQFLIEHLPFRLDNFTDNNKIISVSKTGNIVEIETLDPHGLGDTNADDLYISGVWSKWNITSISSYNDCNNHYFHIITNAEDILFSTIPDMAHVCINNVFIKDIETDTIIQDCSGIFTLDYKKIPGSIMYFNDKLFSPYIGTQIAIGKYYIDFSTAFLRTLSPIKYASKPFNGWINVNEITIIDNNKFSYECNEFAGEPYIDNNDNIVSAYVKTNPRIYATGIQLEQMPNISISVITNNDSDVISMDKDCIYCLYTSSAGLPNKFHPRGIDGETNIMQNTMSQFAIVIYIVNGVKRNNNTAFAKEINSIIHNIKPAILASLSNKTFSNPNNFFSTGDIKNGLTYVEDRQISSFNKPVYAHIITFQEQSRSGDYDRLADDLDYPVTGIFAYNNLDNQNISNIIVE